MIEKARQELLDELKEWGINDLKNPNTSEQRFLVDNIFFALRMNKRSVGQYLIIAGLLQAARMVKTKGDDHASLCTQTGTHLSGDGGQSS